MHYNKAWPGRLANRYGLVWVRGSMRKEPHADNTSNDPKRGDFGAATWGIQFGAKLT